MPAAWCHVCLARPVELRISKDVDPVSRETVAYHAEWLRTVDNPYYLDGRPRPSPLAAHTFGGFSTAEWVGDMLKITTTNLKEDYYRRNGVPSLSRTGSRLRGLKLSRSAIFICWPAKAPTSRFRSVPTAY